MLVDCLYFYRIIGVGLCSAIQYYRYLPKSFDEID